MVTTGEVGWWVELGIEAGIGREGYRIVDGPGGSVKIVGHDERGLLYGVGRFLRSSRYDCGGFTPGAWRGTSVPCCPMRGIYLATHFNNDYEAASPEELERYVEDLSLWGFNLLILAYPHWQYAGYNDAAARKMTEHLRRLMEVAKRVGMRVSVGDALNGGFTSTPQEMRCAPVPDPLGRHGNFGVNLCPSKSAARAELLKNWEQLLDQFADPGLDCVTYWPYDEGGCGCPDCWPWGARGHLSLSRAVSALVRQKSPHVKVILSTWTFDTPLAGEWEALSAALEQDKSWADYIQADAHEDFPRFPLERGVPGGLPLINFPEISMWGQNPWGGYGANPLPGRLQRLWDQTRRKLSGGTPYSEGIYEDIKNVFVSARDGDDNHDDGIQAFLFNVGTGTLRDVTLRGNIILARETDDLPFPNELQGIGCFDGPLVDFTLEKNVVGVNHWHGITLGDAQGCSILDNVCFSRWSGRARPWVQLGQKKNQAAGNTVCNNFAHSFDFKADAAVQAENNQEVTEAVFNQRLAELARDIDRQFGERHSTAKRPRLESTPARTSISDPTLRFTPSPKPYVVLR